jgi:hypothetical protein
MISAAVKPYIRSAAAFQLVITPSSVALTIESFADSTMAAASSAGRSNSRLARTSGSAPGRPEPASLDVTALPRSRVVAYRLL